MSRLLLILLAAGACGGCFRDAHEEAHRSRGVSLSEVSAAASDGGGGAVGRHDRRDEADRARPDHHHHRSAHEDHHHAHGSAAVGVAAAPAAAGGDGGDSGPGLTSLFAGYGLQHYEDGQPIEREHRIDLVGLSHRDGMLGGALWIGFSVVDLAADEPTTVGIDDVWGVHFSGALRLHPLGARDELLVDPYLELGMRAKRWFWDYENPVIVDGDEIRNDSIPAYDFTLGVGAQMRLDHLFIDAAFDPGLSIFDGQSDQGFRNDIFEDAWFWGARLGVGFTF